MPLMTHVLVADDVFLLRYHIPHKISQKLKEFLITTCLGREEQVKMHLEF